MDIKVHENKADFILELHERQMQAKTEQQKILFQMLKELGVRWTEIMQEGLQGQPIEVKKDFFADYTGATMSFICWLIVSSIKPYVPDDLVEGGMRAMLKDINKRIEEIIPDINSIKKDDL